MYEWCLVGAGVDGQPAVAGVGVVEVDEGGDHGVPLEGEVAVVLVHRERGAGPGRLQVSLGVVLGGNSTDFLRKWSKNPQSYQRGSQISHNQGPAFSLHCMHIKL